MEINNVNAKIFETKKWFRLDNSGTVYPLTMTHATQSLFRLGVQLNNLVDGDALLIALRRIMIRYPSFNVELRSGVFRHFFDSNNELPVVGLEHGELLKKINFRHNNGYLFRVTYYQKSIFIDFYHALCDGNSGMEFLKSLTYQYLIEVGEDVTNDGSVNDIQSQYSPEEAEDSFLKYYKKIKVFEGAKLMKGKRVCGLKGKQFKKEGHGLIQGTLKTDEVIKLVKQLGCSITVFLISVYLLSVVRVNLKTPTKKDLAVLVPIDLRKIFPSKALNNFVIFTRCYLNPNITPHTLEDFIIQIKKELTDGLHPDVLQKRLSAVSLMDKNIITKALPLPIKKAITKLGKMVGSGVTMTSILSNLGIVKMPPSTHKFIDKFIFNLNVTNKTPNNIAVASFNNKLVISSTRQLISTEIEKEFFTIMSSLGLSVEIISNLREIRDL